MTDAARPAERVTRGARLGRASIAIGGLLLVQAGALEAVELGGGATTPRAILAHLGGTDVRLAVVQVAWAALVLVLWQALVRIAVLAPPIRRRWLTGLAEGRHGLLLVEQLGTWPVAVFLVARLNGIADVAALVPVYALIGAVPLLQLAQERMRGPAGAERRPAALIVAAVIGIVPWGVIAFVQLGSGLVGAEVPAAVRVVTLVMLAAQALLVVLHWRGRSDPARAVRAELGGMLIGATAVSAFAWIAALAL